ncbi:hypothetical protein MAUB_58610 [Mycolicibacterium aubagnense]|uniref:Uncharacterized protein n=1 Tax=Mycolicibacterium aubagnense TaxID=319707 RepID=A0ABM7IMT0_9MYCO|nr:hypothetical protein MAUB_58610 [Mycolicibacterium aubagnense]
MNASRDRQFDRAARRENLESIKARPPGPPLPMTVATLFPAQTDESGTTWYRTGPRNHDTWTSDPARAHPDYASAATFCGRKPMTAGDRTAVLQFASMLRTRAELGSHCNCGPGHGCVCAGESTCG